MEVTSLLLMMVTLGPGVRFIRGCVPRGGGIITCFSRLPSLLSSCGGNFTTTDEGDTGARGQVYQRGCGQGWGYITCFSRLPSLLSSCGGNFTTTDDGDTGA